MKTSLWKNKVAWFIFIYDILCAETAWFLSNLFIFGRIHFVWEGVGFIFIGFAVAVKFFRTYASFWKSAALIDLKRNIYAVITGVGIFFVLEFLYSRLSQVPRSLMIFFPLLTFFLMLLGRLVYRQMLLNRGRRYATKKILLIGAGCGAELFLRENENLPTPYHIVGILDDDKRKHSKLLWSFLVIGKTNLLTHKSFLHKYNFDEVLVAIPSIRSKYLDYLYTVCHEIQKPINVLPRMMQLAQGARVTDLKEVDIEDLLSRDPVKIEFDQLERMYDGTSVLVTGGGGSIGSEICRQLLMSTHLKTLVVLDHSEYHLYQVQSQLAKIKHQVDLIFKLVNVANNKELRQLLDKSSIDTIFHAAAYKHVPLLESQPEVAIQNNINGTRTLLDLAVKYSVKKFIMISTDKAVNPTNVMGATKRIAELYVQAKRKAKTRFIVTRFGNVLGSNGSVVPLFKSQLKAGGPITVTDPNIERYFMTIDEAASLVLLSGAIGKGGETFILDMGKPVKIKKLAEQLITLSGQRPGVDVQIKYTGLRPGEKLYEELFYAKEKLVDSGYKKLKIGQSTILSKTEITNMVAKIDKKQTKQQLLEAIEQYR